MRPIPRSPCFQSLPKLLSERRRHLRGGLCHTLCRGAPRSVEMRAIRETRHALSPAVSLATTGELVGTYAERRFGAPVRLPFMCL